MSIVQTAQAGVFSSYVSSVSIPETTVVPGITVIPAGKRSYTFTLFTSISSRFSSDNVYSTISPILQASTFTVFSRRSATFGTSATSKTSSSPDTISTGSVSNVQ